MRVLVLWADHRSPNLGVRALAAGTEALVRQVWPAAEVDVQNYGRGASPLPIGAFRSLAKEYVTGRAGMGEWLASYDLVVDTRSGDSFTDIYGMPRLRTMSLLAEWAHRVGTPVVMGPQTIGPFQTQEGRWLGRRSIRQSTAVIARDSASAAYAMTTLRRTPDATTTDVVFSLTPPPPSTQRDVLLNVSGLLWSGSPHVDADGYRTMVRGILSGLVADGRRVSLLAHVLDAPSADNDVPALRELADEGGDLEVVIPESLDDARSSIASARLVIGSRMHACLNALSVGTPAIPLAYSRKFAPLLADIDWPYGSDLRCDTDIVATTLRSAAASDLAERAAESCETARRLLDRARQVIADTT